MDDGHATISEAGFLISTLPLPKLGDPNTQKLITDANSSEFEKTINDLAPDKKYFYRAYAINTEGISLGAIEKFKSLVIDHSPNWIDAQPAKENNWWVSPWFGTFYAPDNRGWIMHRDLGWLFALKQPERAVWLWNENLGWIWTHPDHFPFLYSNQLGNWMFFYGQRNGRLLFYDYGANRWMINFE